jgi:hypothetical protein
MRRLVLLLALFAMMALGADVTGTWKGKAETPNGTVERTFVFKVEGTTLTGETVSEMMGKSTITNGKVDGDNLSFNITVNFQGQEMKLTYSGKVSGNEIKFSVTTADGNQVVEYLAKKVS